MKAVLLPAIALSLFWTAAAVPAQESPASGNPFLEPRLHPDSPGRTPWLIEPHRPNYVLPVSYIRNPSENLEQAAANTDVADEAGLTGDKLQEIEVKFQLSLQLPLARDVIAGHGDLYVAYTQVSVWQAYNRDYSSPFRDTNYEPEGYLSFDTDCDLLGLRLRIVQCGFVHQSNGRADLLSRSWNRIYANFILERGNFACALKPWWRIPESEEEDNNPRIENYYGYGELRTAYKWREHVFAALLRNNFKFDGNKGALELNWAFPLAGQLKGFVQFFTGYGETLLDYDETDERLGIGLLLADWE